MLAHDENTPLCSVCGNARIGILSTAYALLRGNYVFVPALGHEVFVLDADLGAEFFKLPNGAQAIILDVDKKNPASAVAHADCLNMAVQALDEACCDGLYGDEGDEDGDQYSIVEPREVFR